jgi:hypothetical protein
MYDAPGITFHWGGWWVHKLNMHANALYWDDTAISLDGHDHYRILPTRHDSDAPNPSTNG